MPLPPLLVMTLAYPAEVPPIWLPVGPPEVLAKMFTPSPALFEIVLAAIRLSEILLAVDANAGGRRCC